MNGTEKQVKYAQSLIQQAYDACDHIIDDYIKRNAEIFCWDIIALKRIRLHLMDEFEHIDDATTIIKNKHRFSFLSIQEQHNDLFNRICCDTKYIDVDKLHFLEKTDISDPNWMSEYEKFFKEVTKVKDMA